MKKAVRLTRSTDFKRVRRYGKSYAHPLLVLIVNQDEALQMMRLGVTAGRSVGRAVERNRAKRRIRAAADQIVKSLQPGWEVVIVARKPILEASFEDIQAALIQVMKRARLFVEVEGQLERG